MKTRLSTIFKTTNVTNFVKAILKSSYRVPKVTLKYKTLKQPVYFLNAVEFCPTFDIQIDITLAIFREKLQNHRLQKAYRGLSKHNISIGPPITKQQPFRNMENLCFLTVLFFKIKIAEILNFQWIKYLGESLSYVKN